MKIKINTYEAYPVFYMADNGIKAEITEEEFKWIEKNTEDSNKVQEFLEEKFEAGMIKCIKEKKVLIKIRTR